MSRAAPKAGDVKAMLNGRSIVLVGLMGAGKTTVGRRLASVLKLSFVDADSEIEKAAGKSVQEIFAEHGESYFRDGERRVIARLLDEGPQVLATGGGAFMNPATRLGIKEHGISVWLRADIALLMKRVLRRSHRPLLKQTDPHQVMERLMEERYPVYATADLIVDSQDVPHDQIVRQIVEKLATLTETP
jgi:shikimate kinase